uniref:Xaa-Pro aminopeptidase 1 n=1 Tax=Scylla olivacea TaxID=85551 RepID=A0A0P4VTN1_SCYOL
MRGIHLLTYLVSLQVAGVVVRGCHIPTSIYSEDDESEVQPWSRGDRVTREVTLGERLACGPDVTPDLVPPNRVITTERVSRLKKEMIRRSLDGYIIPSSDEHQSEYVAPADERRRYISGFSGSYGVAVVTARHQALWTDGRYFLQADQELDCNWLLMKMKNPGVPKMTEWLQTTLRPGAKVGADPRLIGAETWISYAEDLAKFNITLEAEEMNLVDLVWPQQERPKYSEDPIFVLETRFAGKSWEEKVREVRQEMVKKGADMLVVTALDEVAWLLNLRGNDIPYNPVFRAYVILAPDRLELYVPAGKIMPAVDSHLRVNQCGDGRECVTINDYVSILDSLRALRLRNTVKKVLLGAKYSYSGGASYAIYSAVPEKMRVKDTSPILLMKARKNPKEVEGMKRAHVKDAVALCDFLSFLENEIEAGRYWSEISAAQTLGEYRGQQQDFVGISFDTISAFGSNGAIVHYAPSKETSKQITNESLYLLDSGGQYKDGTTDVTRTLHYGTPTPMQVEAYTRVLMGAVDLATLVFPEGTGDTDVDILARRHLYAVGLDYRHGTGHGIGMFLNVHEAPIQVRIYGGEEHKFEVGHFFSDAFESTYRLNYFGSHGKWLAWSH